MVELTGRQRACLRHLCQQGSFVTTAELARRLGVSERTVRTDLGAIEAFAREKGVELVRVPGSGVRLSCDAAMRASLAARLDEAGASVLERPERATIVEVMLLVRPTVTFQQMAEACNVSRRTIVSQFDEIALFFEGAGIELVREQGVGSSLRGPERALRRCFMGIVTSPEASRAARLAARGELPADCLGRARSLVERIEGLQGTSFVDPEAIELELAYALARLDGGNALGEEPGGDVDDLARVLPEGLDELLATDFPAVGERRFAELLVLSQRISGVSAARSGDEASDVAEHISRDLIAALRELQGIDEGAVHHLIEGLTNHLRAAIYRSRNNIQVESEISRQIVVSIPLLYDFTRQQMRLAERRYGVCLNESEVAYVAMYLDAIYESCAREAISPSVLFVCPFGLASSSMLMTRLSFALAECSVLGPMTEREARSYLAGHDVDLVVSTSPCRLGTTPVVTVDPLMRQSEVERVKRRLMQLSYTKLCSYFLSSYVGAAEQDEASRPHRVGELVRPSDVQVGVGCDDWREAIRLAARPLVGRGVIEERYVDRMVSAVEDFGPYMVLTPKTAYVHAGVNDGVRENCAAVLVLRRDIPMGPHDEKSVRCVIALGIHDAETSPLLTLAPIFDREETVRALERSDLTVDEVLDLHD